MQFIPKSQEELAAERLWPDGVYPFSVQSAEDAVSKSSGKEMIVVELCFYNEAGKSKVIKDYLLASQLEKLSQFCRFTGIEDLYDAGTLVAADMENKEGYAKLRTEKPKPDSDFKPKNVVAWYCPKPEERADAREMEAKRKEIEAGLTAGTGGEEDEIPF